MQKKLVILSAAIALSALRLPSQTAGTVTTFTFAPVQEADTLVQVKGDVFMLPQNAALGPSVSGKPVSATEESKTVQTLGDGTEIVNSSTRQFYRDVVGRTRIEQTIGGQHSIVLRDPVSGFSARLDPASKTATRTAMPNGGRGGRGVATTTTSAGDSQTIEVIVRQPATVNGQTVTIEGQPVSSATATSGGRAGRIVNDAEAISVEDLGVQTINNVPAVGTRRTQTIAAGQIGNSRDIHVVNERWYSEDLQMVVKTVNSDPRFGTTTYELTNIRRDNPDPSLFQIPAGYSIVEGGRRGAVRQ